MTKSIEELYEMQQVQNELPGIANGLDASNWLVLKNLSDRMVVKHRFLGSERTVFK